METIQKYKELTLEVKENKEKYISGELELTPVLDKTDKYYQACSADTSSAAHFLQDSSLMHLETEIVRSSAKSYKVAALTFDPRAFSLKVKSHFGFGRSDEDSRQSQRNPLHTLWSKLGEYSMENMYLVPTMDFIYGTFDADPVEPEKKKRKPYVKSKLGDVTKPQTMDVSEVLGGKDPMCEDASRIYSLFLRLTERNKRRDMCFYEFVIDPTSFSRTVEHIFLVTLLLNMGHLYLFSDDQGLPFLRAIPPKEKEELSTTVTQCALSMSVEEWKETVETFNFTSPVIPPRTQNEE